MQLDAQLISILGFVVTILTTLGAIFISHGVAREKIQRLEKDMVEHRSDTKYVIEQIRNDYVTLQHFEGIIGPIRDSMHEMHKDLKTILSRV